jgi:hypothetical protein
MKYIKIKFMTFLTLCLLVSTAMAQDEGTFHRNFIGATLTQLPFGDYRFSYERRIAPSHGFKVELGYKPAYKSFTDATNIDLGQDATGWCYRNTADWYYISLGYRNYFNKKKTFYLSPELFYKIMTADMIVYSWGMVNSDYSRNAFELRSMHTDCIGLNLLIGKRARIRFSKGFNMGLDIYSGLTLRTKMIHTTTYGHVEIGHYHDEGVGYVSIPVSDHPTISDTQITQVMLQFGIVLYASWK